MFGSGKCASAGIRIVLPCSAISLTLYNVFVDVTAGGLIPGGGDDSHIWDIREAPPKWVGY